LAALFRQSVLYLVALPDTLAPTTAPEITLTAYGE